MPRLLPIAELGQPVIRERAVPIANPGDEEIQALIDDMLHTVAEVGGMGIAAPQVFVPKRLVIIASRPNERYPYAPNMEPTAMINPEIAWASETKETDWEGCLTVPGIRGLVPRHESIAVRYLSRSGTSVETEFQGFLARVFQHEVDHLDGVVFLDRVGSTKDLVTEKEWRKQVKNRRGMG